MKAKGGKWTYDDLNKFITNPKGFVPGTAMGFAGIQKDSERADVIDYLHTLAENPVPLPTAAKYRTFGPHELLAGRPGHRLAVLLLAQAAHDPPKCARFGGKIVR